MKVTRVYCLMIVASLVFAGETAFAVPTYSFKAITANGVANTAIGEAQLFVEVTNEGLGPGQVLFTFKNVGPAPSSICDVYFDDGSLLGLSSIQNTPGLVEFSQYANPGNLPGGNNIIPHFETTEGFSADSDSPVQPMGVNPGEQLGILFDLQTGKTYANVLSDLDSHELRIGIHVQGFADGESESFVNNGVVPVPGAALLGSIGVGLVGWMRRRRML